MKPNWRLKLKLLSATIMIKLGKLKHADYTEDELTDILNQQLPESFEVDVPISKGELTLLEGTISMPNDSNTINVELLGSILIGPAGKPIYRAHLLIHLAVLPIYIKPAKTVAIDKMLIKDIQLVNDAYSIIESSKDLLSILVPKQVQNMVSGTLLSAVGLLTGGASDAAAEYMKLYLSGSKQRILDHHRPQIETLVSEFAKSDELQYKMGYEDFEEHLFCLHGNTVAVEEGALRFKF